MKLDYDESELEHLMKDFYLLTGIRIVLFDADYRELLSYPKHPCKFCEKMKQAPSTRQLCNESDRISFETCKWTNELIIYHCHAGLIEATAPLLDHHAVIGYMMFGQISDAGTETDLCHLLHNTLVSLPGAVSDATGLTADIPLKTTEQIQAAAKIMEACTFYVIMKNTITVRRDNFIRNMDAYLLEHLSEDLSVTALSRALGISKSKLYQNYALYYDHSIAEHIRMLRIETAKKMLVESDASITDIAGAVGFADYNYFCRVFKKEVGIPAKKYRRALKK